MPCMTCMTSLLVVAALYLSLTKQGQLMDATLVKIIRGLPQMSRAINNLADDPTTMIVYADRRVLCGGST